MALFYRFLHKKTEFFTVFFLNLFTFSAFCVIITVNIYMKAGMAKNEI